MWKSTTATNITFNIMSLRCAIILILISVTGALDPCVDHYYLYDNGDRSPSCPPTSDQSDNDITDHWYKLVNMKGALNLTDRYVAEHSCGVHHPIWLNGSHPEMDEGVVNRSVCVTAQRCPCFSTYAIQIKNCSSYYVYYLRRTKYNQRYCFNSTSQCSPSTMPTTTTWATTTTNETSDDDHHSHPYPTGYYSYSKFGCMMFIGGFLIGALLVAIIVLVRAKRAMPSRPRPCPPARATLPPSYREAVGGTPPQTSNMKY